MAAIYGLPELYIKFASSDEYFPSSDDYDFMNLGEYDEEDPTLLLKERTITISYEER